MWHLFGLGLASHANAAIMVNFTDASYVGFIDNGIPASDVLEVSYINHLRMLDAGDGATTFGTSDETYYRTFSTIPKASLPAASDVLMVRRA